MMADVVSQNDLDALFGKDGGGTADGAASGGNGNGSGGLSQADLDNLLGDLGDLGAKAAAESPPPAAAAPAPGSDNLSQDDIDRLLAEFGK